MIYNKWCLELANQEYNGNLKETLRSIKTSCVSVK